MRCRFPFRTHNTAANTASACRAIRIEECALEDPLERWGEGAVPGRREGSTLAVPAGGVHAGRGVRAWRRRRGAAGFSEPLRCRREQWYLIRARTCGALRARSVVLRFQRQAHPPLKRAVELRGPDGDGPSPLLLGWIQTPGDATHVELGLSGAEIGALRELSLFATAERDAKCHPLAAIPAWSTLRPAFPMERVVLPVSLAGLAELLPGRTVEIIDRPRAWRSVAERALGSLCVLDPAWPKALGIGLREIRTLAGGSWLILDLETTAALLRGAGWDVQTVALRDAHGVFSARVSYSDVPTRGFALEDVFPYGTLTADGGFACRALRGGRVWKAASNELSIASVLMLEGPRFEHSRHVLSAMAAEGLGEWIASDLPWLAAGTLGAPLAPRIVRHAFRMLAGSAIADGQQFWNRWDDAAVVLRDIADLPRRFDALRTVRWARDEESGVARLGLSLGGEESGGSHGVAGARRHLVISTGRIDQTAIHDGVPPEPMLILMKALARGHTANAGPKAFGGGTRLTWQFDAADGLRYASHFGSAAELPDTQNVHVLRLHAERALDKPLWVKRDSGAGGAWEQAVRLPEVQGVLGDGSLDYLRMLVAVIETWLESLAPGAVGGERGRNR